MAEPIDAKCPKCNGTQWIYDYNDEEILPRPCDCLAKKDLYKYLGREIANSAHVKSPLFVPGVRDATQEDVFLRGTWSMACRHLHWVLAGKWFQDTGFSYRIVDDDMLTQVWLGKYAYKERPKELREEIDTYNSLGDLLEGPQLVIIRLGVLRRNKAAGDVLSEALGVRSRVSKPTWIAEDRDEFAPGHPTYTERVFLYIHSRFTFENLGGELEDDDDVAMGLEVDTPRTVSTPKAKPYKPTPPPDPEPTPSSGSDDDLFGGWSPLGGSESKRRPFKRRSS